MKHLLFIILALFIFLSCDDYIEKGIEGKWQMTKVVNNVGMEESVDTIFYSFKKGVFEYLKLETDLISWRAHGLYSEVGDSLFLEIRSSVDPVKSDWNETTIRHFKIEKRTSSEMKLKHEDDTYVFRIY